jgi:flagellar basal-body rod protein FlgB
MSHEIERAVLLRALDGLHLRQLALAQNIAASGTAGSPTLRVDFEQALAAAARSGDARRVATSPIQLQHDPVAFGLPPRLDLQVAQAQENAARYGALLGIVDRQLQLEHLALNDGRGR